MNNTNNAALVVVILALICGLGAIGRTLAMTRREEIRSWIGRGRS